MTEPRTPEALRALPKGRFWTVLAVVLFVALVIRVAFIFVVSHHETALYDAFYYRFMAIRLSLGQGFRSVAFLGPGVQDAQHPPLTALVLTPAAWIFGLDDLPMRFVMTGVGLVALVIIALVARELAGDRAGLIAAVTVAVYPNLWVNDGLIMSESVSAATVALTILLTYRLVRRPTPWRAAWVGVACGLALLTRAEVVLLVPMMIVPAAAFTRCVSLKARSGLIAVVLVTTALTALPWVVYNATRFEKPVLLSTGDGEAFLGANCPRTYSGRDLGGWSGPCSIRASTRGDQSVVDAYRRTIAFRYMSDHASRIPVVVAARVGRAWSLFRPVQVAKETSVEGRPQLVSLSGLAMFYLLVPLAIVGVVVLRRRRTMLIPLLAPIVLVTLTAAAVRGEIRFRIPAEVAIVVLAAVATDAILRRWLDARGPRLATEQGR